VVFVEHGAHGRRFSHLATAAAQARRHCLARSSCFPLAARPVVLLRLVTISARIDLGSTDLDDGPVLGMTSV
jgi:hypothetical protein